MNLYTVDQYGIIRLGSLMINQTESDADYKAYFKWLMMGGVLETIISDAPKPELAKYKTDALTKLIEIGNKFVGDLTADLLECELQTFPTLTTEAKSYLAGVRGADVCQITIQATMTGKTPEAVVERTLKLSLQQKYVTPIMSGMRQNASVMIHACVTHDQVDAVVAQIKVNAKAVIDQMMSQVGMQGGL
jgi:hypothetical protein